MKYKRKKTLMKFTGNVDYTFKELGLHAGRIGVTNVDEVVGDGVKFHELLHSHWT